MLRHLNNDYLRRRRAFRAIGNAEEMAVLAHFYESDHNVGSTPRCRATSLEYSYDWMEA